MTSTTRITDFPDGVTTAGGEMVVVQDGRTKHVEFGTAVFKSAGGNAGELPILNSAGAVAAGDGGTGLSLVDNASLPNQYFGRDAAGSLGMHTLPQGGGGGGSVNFATETSFLQGTSAALALSPLSVDDWRRGVDNAILAEWGAWDSVDQTTASSLPLDGGSFGGYGVDNAAGKNAETTTIATGTLRIFGPLCTDLPSPSAGTFAFGLAGEDVDGTRWMLVCNTANVLEFFRLSGGTWHSEATNGAGTRPSFYGLENNNRWAAVSSLASGNPQSTAVPYMGRRNGGQVDAVWLGYTSSTFRIFSTDRDLASNLTAGSVGTIQLANGAVTNAKVASNAGIAQSKLDLSITNSEVAANAAIAQSKLADLVLADLPIHGTPTDGQVVSYDATNSRLTYSTPSSGGSTPADGSITYAKMAASAIASEQDIFDDPSSNTALVANKTLADALEERDEQLGAFWSAWFSLTPWTLSTIGNAGIAIEGFGSGLVMKNTSSFNARTSSIGATDLNLCGTSCDGLPSLSNGQLRGGLLFLDTEGTRWFMPIANEEQPDAETFFRVSGNNWVAVGYKGDELRVHLHGLLNDQKWNPFAAHKIGGPGSAINVFNGEAAIARRDGDIIRLVRGTYSTSTNSFTISIANQVFTIPLRDGQVSTAKLADGAITEPKLAANNTPSDDQVLAWDATNSRLYWKDDATGGGGSSFVVGGTKAAGKVIKATGTGTNDQSWQDDDTTPADGSITAGKLANGAVTAPKVASSAYASEEDILSATSNNRVIGNATLKGIIEDISADHLWSSWSAASITNQTTLPNPGLWTIPNLGGDGQMAVVNASQFNAQTANIGSGRPNLFGPLSSGLPNHSGTQRGCIVILDDQGRRWALPIAEVPDAEATYELVSNSWVARGYRGDELRIDFARIRSDADRYEVFGSLAINGPTDNALRDEVLLARSDGRSQYALRVAYSTADSRYEIVTAKRDAIFNLRDDEVQASNIDTTNAGSDGQMLVKAGEQFTYQDVPSGGGGGGLTIGGTQAQHSLIKATSSSAQIWGLLTNDNVASNAAIAQSKLADIAVDDLPTIPYTKLSGTPTIPTQLPPTDGSVTEAKLAAHNTPTDDQVLSWDNDNSRLYWKDDASGGGGGLTIGGTKAAGKFIQATGTGANDQSWNDITLADLPIHGTPADGEVPTYSTANSRLEFALPSGSNLSYEDIVRFSTPVNSGNAGNNTNSDNTDRTLAAGKSFGDYDFLIIERKERPGSTIITSHSPMFLREPAVGLNDEIIAFPNWSSSVVNGINIDIKTNTTWRIAFIGPQLRDGTGEGLAAIIGVNVGSGSGSGGGGTPADGSITTAKLADEAVTTAKIDDDAVTAAKIADGTLGISGWENVTPSGISIDIANRSNGDLIWDGSAFAPAYAITDVIYSTSINVGTFTPADHNLHYIPSSAGASSKVNHADGTFSRGFYFTDPSSSSSRYYISYSTNGGTPSVWLRTTTNGSWSAVDVDTLNTSWWNIRSSRWSVFRAGATSVFPATRVGNDAFRVSPFTQYSSTLLEVQRRAVIANRIPPPQSLRYPAAFAAGIAQNGDVLSFYDPQNTGGRFRWKSAAPTTTQLYDDTMTASASSSDAETLGSGVTWKGYDIIEIWAQRNGNAAWELLGRFNPDVLDTDSTLADPAGAIDLGQIPNNTSLSLLLHGTNGFTLTCSSSISRSTNVRIYGTAY